MNTQPPASEAGTIVLGGDLPVSRLGFGAMRLTGKKIWCAPGHTTGNETADKSTCARHAKTA